MCLTLPLSASIVIKQWQRIALWAMYVYFQSILSLLFGFFSLIFLISDYFREILYMFNKQNTQTMQWNNSSNNNEALPYCTKRIFKWFDVEYGIYFTSGTEFFFLLFSRLQSTGENIETSRLKSEINSIFIIKPLNFLFITFSLVFEHVSVKS